MKNSKIAYPQFDDSGPTKSIQFGTGQCSLTSFVYYLSSYKFIVNSPSTWALMQNPIAEKTVNVIKAIERDEILLKHSNDLIVVNKNKITPKHNLIYNGLISGPLKLITANLK